MEQPSSSSSDSKLFGIPTRQLAIGAGVVAAGGLAYLAYKLLFARPGFVAYHKTEEPGVVRMLPYLTEQRIPVLSTCFDEKEWAKLLAKANDSDDYKRYIEVMQDLFLFHLMTEDIQGCVNCLEAQLEVIQPRVFKQGVKGGYDLNAPELIDYIKWACTAIILFPQAGQEAKARELASSLLEIDYAIAAARQKEKDESTSTTSKYAHLPRVLYGAQQYVLTQLEAHSKAAMGGGSGGGMDSPVDPDAIAQIMLKAKDYAEEYLPSDFKRLSADELRHLLSLYGALSEYYDSINNKQTELEILLKILNVIEFLGASQSPDAFFTRKKIANIYVGQQRISDAFEQLEICVDGVWQLCAGIPDTPNSREEVEVVAMLFDVVFGLRYIAGTHRVADSDRLVAKLDNLMPQLRAKFPQMYNAFVSDLTGQAQQ